MILLTPRPYIKKLCGSVFSARKKLREKTAHGKNFSKEHHLFSSIRNVVPRPTSDAFTKIRPW